MREKRICRTNHINTSKQFLSPIYDVVETSYVAQRIDSIIQSFNHSIIKIPTNLRSNIWLYLMLHKQNETVFLILCMIVFKYLNRLQCNYQLQQ